MKKLVHKSFLRALQINRLALLLVVLGVGLCAFKPGDIWDTPTNVSVVKCYPNPAISYVNFEFPQQIDKDYTLYIYSFVGRKMAELPVTSRKIILPLTGYYRGLYVFQLRDKTGKIIETGKFQVEQ